MNQYKTINYRYWMVVLLLINIGMLAACDAVVKPLPTETNTISTALPPVVTNPSPIKTVSAPLTEAMLKNATYQGIYQEAVQLSDGTYIGPASDAGTASKPTINFIGPYAFGDLNSDGVEDAAVILAESSGGSGSFVYLAVVLNQQGKPSNVATLLLGDRVQIQSLKVAEGQIILMLIQQGPNDPMCCPTQAVENVYTLEGNKLILTASKTLS